MVRGGEYNIEVSLRPHLVWTIIIKLIIIMGSNAVYCFCTASGVDTVLGEVIKIIYNLIMISFKILCTCILGRF